MISYRTFRLVIGNFNPFLIVVILLQAVLSDLEVTSGLRLAPSQIPITVTHEPVENLLFHQFRALVQGSIICLGKRQCHHFCFNIGRFL